MSIRPVLRGAARARRLAASSTAFGLLLLAATSALADGASLPRGRLDPFDARLFALERELAPESLPLLRALPARELREAPAIRDSVVPRDAPIEFRVMGPLAEDSAAGLALEIRF